VGKCAIYYTRKSIGRDVNIYYIIENCKDEKRDLVVTETARLRNVKFERGLCCKLCFVLQEMCYESRYLTKKGKQKCLHDGIVCKAVVAIIVVRLDVVVKKIYTWICSEGV
jgi:hypothetical protein